MQMYKLKYINNSTIFAALKVVMLFVKSITLKGNQV
jgi:hypothetical protein